MLPPLAHAAAQAGALEGAVGSAAERPVLAFGLALAIGALIGIERERQKGGERGSGLRTFVLVAEAGALAAWLAQRLETPWIFALGGAFVTAFLVAGYVAEARLRPTAIGLTTEIACLVTYLLGGAVVHGEAELAVALAIATTAVLAFKEPLHGAVARIGRGDLESTLKLLVATFVVLPVLPNRPVDPWGVLNPYAMWWLVILISALSFAGYVATRVLGAERGLVMTGLAGGLVSSTAVTLGFARQSRAREGASVDPMAAGLLLAWAVMFARVLVTVTVVFRPLLPALSWPLGLTGATTLALAARHYARARAGGAGERPPQVELANPFRLTASIRFALVFAVVLLVVEAARRWLPAGGMYAVAALAGLTDVDAITLSMAGVARDGAALELAAGAIVTAAVANTVTKCGLVVTLGSAALRREVVRATVWILATALAGLALVALT